MYRPCDLYGFQSKMLFEKKKIPDRYQQPGIRWKPIQIDEVVTKNISYIIPLHLIK